MREAPKDAVHFVPDEGDEERLCGVDGLGGQLFPFYERPPLELLLGRVWNGVWQLFCSRAIVQRQGPLPSKLHKSEAAYFSMKRRTSSKCIVCVPVEVCSEPTLIDNVTA